MTLPLISAIIVVVMAIVIYSKKFGIKFEVQL